MTVDTESKNDEAVSNSQTNENAIAKDQRPILLYEHLCKSTNKRLQVQIDYLKEKIDHLEDSKNPDNGDWLKIKNYNEIMICDPLRGVRQDSMIDIKNGNEIIDYPNKSLFKYEHLKGLSDKYQDSQFSFNNEYDMNSYLSNLLINAHSLNETFQKTMKFKIFKLPLKSSRDLNQKQIWNEKKTFLYMEGPVKKAQRCKVKAGMYYTL